MAADLKTINWYNENARYYTNHVRDFTNSLKHSLYEKPAMYSNLPDLTGKKVLSLGCGSGEDSIYLKKCGARESIGLDISEKLLEIAKESYPECSFHMMDMEKLDFEDETFDFAYSSLAIHYNEDWSKTFNEVYRVLKSGSYFLFSCGHPVYSALKIRNQGHKKYKELSIVKNKEKEEVDITGDYLNQRVMPKGTMDVTTWHKPIGQISLEISQSGFVIEKIFEPKPLEEMKEISKETYEELSKIPQFIIFKLLKK